MEVDQSYEGLSSIEDEFIAEEGLKMLEAASEDVSKLGYNEDDYIV